MALLNIGGDVDGAQFGLLNIGSQVRGTQVGLINIATKVDGLSLAPVSILREGRTQLTVFSDTAVIANAGVKYATGPLYSLFALGGDPIPEQDRSVALGAGIRTRRLRKLSTRKRAGAARCDGRRLGLQAPIVS
jgi:hypothetical protein